MYVVNNVKHVKIICIYIRIDETLYKSIKWFVYPMFRKCTILLLSIALSSLKLNPIRKEEEAEEKYNNILRLRINFIIINANFCYESIFAVHTYWLCYVFTVHRSNGLDGQHSVQVTVKIYREAFFFSFRFKYTNQQLQPPSTSFISFGESFRTTSVTENGRKKDCKKYKH